MFTKKYQTSRAPDREMFSDPAKSTKLSFPHLMSSSPSGVDSLMCMVMENKECDRLENRKRNSQQDLPSILSFSS